MSLRREELPSLPVSAASSICEVDLALLADVVDVVQRALYSLIQFTSVTLLYSFASSLGDFQVCMQSLVIDSELMVILWQWLYIDLFMIIPVAVTSKSDQEASIGQQPHSLIF